MNHLNELLMKPHGLYLCTHKSSIHFELRMYVMKWWNEEWNNETLVWLSKSVKHTKLLSALAYAEINNEMMKWTIKWWNEQWNDETLEGLSKSVKHTKWTSVLTYDEKNIHVIRGD